LRRRTKSFKRKPVEVVWVERGDSATMFIIVSAALTLFALLLLFLAFYLR
jgi:preprotein translocase subunit SecE